MNARGLHNFLEECLNDNFTKFDRKILKTRMTASVPKHDPNT